MFKPARNLPTGRRSFRLAPLEMMIIGLIILGVLFLITMWVRTLFSPAPAEETQASPNLALLEQALGDNENIKAQLAEVQKRLGQLGGQGGDGSSQAAPQEWEKRLKAMEEQLNSLGKAGDGNTGALVKKVADLTKQTDALQKALKDAPHIDLKPIESKLAELEKRPAGDPELAKRLDELQKAVKDIPQVDLKPIEAKLAELEKRPAGDPELAVRLDALQKQIAELPRPDLKPIETKLAAMEKTLGRLDKAPEVLAKSITNLEKRVERLEKEASQRPAPADQPARPAPEVLTRLEKLEQSAGPRMGEVNQRLAEVEKSLDALGRDLSEAKAAAKKPGASPADAALLARLDRLERATAAQNEETKKISRQMAGLSQTVDQLEEEPEEPAPTASKPAPKTAPPPPKVAPKPKPAAQENGHLVRYKVRRGDTLYGIARRYHVNVGQIKEWNSKLKRRRYLWVGETLLLYPPKND